MKSQWRVYEKSQGSGCLEEEYRSGSRNHSITKCFPMNELYGLTSQMRRAAVSVPSNIAKGAVRGSAKEFKRSLRSPEALWQN